MSQATFEAALISLQQPQESAGLLRALISIRKEVEWPRNKDNVVKLRDNGYLKQLSAVLQNSTQKNCIDVTLSVLGNCLMDRGCTREVVTQFNLMSIVTQLLKKYPKEDSINGRVFRIIGNMCQHRDQWANIIVDRKPYIVTHIVEVLKRVDKDEVGQDEKVTDATIIMAFKSLRELLNSQTVMPLVKNFGVLKAVGALFIKYSLEWQESKKNEKLLLDIVRLFQEYSRYKYYHSILEMRNTERGDSLIHLSNILVLAPRKIVKIMMNFIRISQLKSELPIPEICGKFIEVLENHSIVKEFHGECIEYLQCLCYLLDHPANRSTERCGKSIPLLIKVLKEFEEPSSSVLECCLLLITTLNKFKYDDSLLVAQLNNNIIKVLLEKLYWLVGNSKRLNLKHASEKKRKYIFGPSSPECERKKTRIKEDFLYDIQHPSPQSPCSSDDEYPDFVMSSRIARSPSPCSSSDSETNALSWASPSSSPTRNLVNEENSDSDEYSPICSEADDSDFPLSIPHAFEENMDENDGHSHHGSPRDEKEEDADSWTAKTVLQSQKVSLLLEITKLLKSYTKLRPSTPHLANEDLLMALIKCSGHFEAYFSNVDTIDVVCKILDSHDYLLPLMQTEFIQTLYDMTEIQHSPWCTKCAQFSQVGLTILRKFTCLAESGVGKGEIAYKMLRGDSDSKKKMVLTIPYIVKNRSLLCRLMLTCGGLDILMKLLRTDILNDSYLNHRSIKVLCAMAARKLGIENPTQLGSGLSRPKIVADKYKTPESDNLVTFKLDCGSKVIADRDFLIQKSDFFNGMLAGHFKESSENEISLPNVDHKSLRCLLHLLTHCEKTETIEIDLDLETLLDVILLCDRYLLVELCVALTNSVEQFRISTQTVPVIYNWSLESGTNLLRVESVAFALVADIEESERLKMFENLFSLGYSEHLVEDIQKLLTRYLNLSLKTQGIVQMNHSDRKGRMKDRLLKSPS